MPSMLQRMQRIQITDKEYSIGDTHKIIDARVPSRETVRRRKYKRQDATMTRPRKALIFLDDALLGTPTK